jgi:predicted PurR-regulated permease PerM
MDAETALVIILSSTLAIFLILSIFVVILVLQLVKKMQQIADKVEHVVDKAESLGELLESSVKPVAVGRIFASVGKHFFGKQKSRR